MPGLKSLFGRLTSSTKDGEEKKNNGEGGGEGEEEERPSLVDRMKNMAIKAVSDTNDPWAKYNLPGIPAERVMQHMYIPATKEWITEMTMVKIETTPFTHGAMRHCYRMKKRIKPPKEAAHFQKHTLTWDKAANFIAKAYMTPSGEIDTSPQAMAAVQNDIMLQYEADYWAKKFNHHHPPRTINFIQAYAIEFVDRPGKPWFAVERYIDGNDEHGCGFIKHNTNSGFVDLDLHRTTPQVFSAYSFYESQGTRLVADIQGVGDLFTDPQVLSDSYEFGEGDLGPRGMALFFQSFRHCPVSDAMGLPIFCLSRNEKLYQAKYHQDEGIISDDEDDDDDNDNEKKKQDDDDDDETLNARESYAKKMDMNRMRRANALTDTNTTKGRNNRTLTKSDAIGQSIRDLSNATAAAAAEDKPETIKRSKSDVNDIDACLKQALVNYKFDHRAFHRKASGEIRERKSSTTTVPLMIQEGDDEDNTTERSMDDFMTGSSNHSAKGAAAAANPRAAMMNQSKHQHQSEKIKMVCEPMIPTTKTIGNLGRIHYQLATLHGMGRFPEVIPTATATTASSGGGEEAKQQPEAAPQEEQEQSHDAHSVLFHLCHASSLQNIPACLALARVYAGLGTVVSDLLPNLVSIDLEGAKKMCRRGMQSPYCTKTADEHYNSGFSISPKAACACLYYQILQNENNSSSASSQKKEDEDDAMTKIDLIQQVLSLLTAVEQEKEDFEKYKESLLSGTKEGGDENKKTSDEKDNTKTKEFKKGDRVKANFALEGNYYAGVIEDISQDGNAIVVKYDDDGSSETLTPEHVRHDEDKAAETPKFQKGDRVEANFALEGTYFAGVIEDVSQDGNCIVVKYDDDGSSETLTPEHVRAVGGDSSSASVPEKPKFQKGDRVEANFALEGNYYAGVIEDVSSDGNCIVVKYDDDGSSETLTPEHVRAMGGGDSSAAAAPAPAPATPKFQKGDRVEANFALEGNYYSGVIEDVSSDGNCIVVKYDDDGSSETLTPEHVRAMGDASSTTPATPVCPFEKGDRVEANFCLEGTYYSGTIEEVAEDGKTVVVKYDDDGSCETLTLEHVRKPGEEKKNIITTTPNNAVPLTAKQSDLGGPAMENNNNTEGGEGEFFNDDHTSDEKIVIETYILKSELAQLMETVAKNDKNNKFDVETIANLYQEAADEAMEDGKMKMATQWSLKASELNG